ncbi:MAG TPA: hypothetical protein VLB29_13620 [Nocardioidaceae bacterium]|nr:hypothetical protein [Nocardioidaceae bacterium]
MIVAAVVCPHPPLLLRELSGSQDAVPELRAACREALAAALATEPDAVVVVGGADRPGGWDPSLPVDVRRFGTTTAPHVAGLPQSLGVAKRLLEEAGWAGPLHLQAVSFDAGPAEVTEAARAVAKAEGRVVLIVLADGSTRRGEKAPGYLDERAFAFDDRVVAALEQGDAPALAGLDPALARELMVLGRAPLAVMGEALGAQAADRGASQAAQEVALEADRGSPQAQAPLPRTRLLYRDDPYGVLYTVVLWDLRPL